VGGGGKKSVGEKKRRAEKKKWKKHLPRGEKREDELCAASAKEGEGGGEKGKGGGLCNPLSDRKGQKPPGEEDTGNEVQTP